MRYIKNISILIFTLTSLLVTGCASLGTAVKHRNLETSVQMSESIFMDELAGTKKTVFIKIQNNTDKSDFQIKNELKDAIIKQGYRITDNANAAGYVLQVSLLRVGRTSRTA